jgi:iron complex outermembrane receptor protein
LILTGQINDVGAPIMVNIPSSYRAGVEMALRINPSKSIRLEGNLTLSRNRIRGFTEYVDDWDTGQQQVHDLGTTDLALSPDVITGGRLTWQILNDLIFRFDSHYVGRQYIDNTSSNDRSIDPYWVSNATLSLTLKPRGFREVELMLRVNNIFNAQYETHAWVYSYYYDGERYKMDGYFPQAGIHFMAGLRARL